MPFFHGSSDPTITNSYLSETAGDFQVVNILNLTTQEPAALLTQLLGKRRERDGIEFDADGLRKRRRSNSRNSDGLMIVNTDEFELRTELISRNGYRMHSASHGAQGRVVVVKVFEGPHAKQDCIKNVAFLKEFLHSNMPKIVGVSDPRSKVPFIIFHGVSEKRIQSLIARALRTDLNKSVELSMKAVKGLAAGLNYISSQEISGALVDIRGWENFDIFAGDNEEPIIAIHVPSTPRKNSLALHSLVVQSDDAGMEALNGLCQKLFSEVNSILYDDSPQRELDPYNALSIASIDEVSKGKSCPTNILSTSNSMEQHRNPRREVRWHLDIGTNNRNLDSIARRFGDYLECFVSSPSDLPLRRIRASREAYSQLRTSHQCPGYLREEITLTSDVSRSVIVSHECPSPSELCLVCGQLVQYQGPVFYPTLPPLEVIQSAGIYYELNQIPFHHLVMLKLKLGFGDKDVENLSMNEKIKVLKFWRTWSARQQGIVQGPRQSGVMQNPGEAYEALLLERKRRHRCAVPEWRSIAYPPSSSHVQSPEIFQGSHLQDASHSINFDDYLTQESDQLIFGPLDLEDVHNFSSPSFQWDSFPDIDFTAWINDSNIGAHSPSSPIPIPSPTDTTSSFIGYQDHTQFSPDETAFSTSTFAALHPLPQSISPPVI